MQVPMHSCTVHPHSHCPLKLTTRSNQHFHHSSLPKYLLRSQKKWSRRTGSLFAVHRCRHSTVMSASKADHVDKSSGFGEGLASWISGHGGKVGKVEVVKEASGTWGLHTSDDCKEGDILIKLPSVCQLTYDESMDPRLLSLIDQVPEALWGGKLSLRLLHERAKGDKSFFDPYLKSLPIGVPGLPIFYSGPVLQGLQYPPVTEQVKMRCRWLVDFATKTLHSVRGSDKDPFSGVDIDVNGLGWGLAVVTSRAFRTRGPDKPAALLPLIDMCNHSFEPNCQIVGDRSDVTLVAKKDIEAGASLFLNYGKLQNDFLLLDYGFVVRNNPYDTVQLRFDVGMVELGRSIGGLSRTKIGKGAREDGSLELHGWQLKALLALRLVGEAADLQLHIGGTEIVDPRLLAAVRILFLSNPSKIRDIDPNTLGSWDTYINPENEVKSLRTLAGLLASITSQFPTSLEEDQTILSEGKMDDPNLPLVLAFRVEKKILLMQAITRIGNRLKELLDSGSQGKGAGESSKNGFG